MMKLSQYLGTKEPMPELGGRSSARAQFGPTMGDVISANIEETFQGEGSFIQDQAAMDVREQTRIGQPISTDDWKASPSFREGLDYYEGMTQESAATLADLEDDRQRRQFIFDKTSGFQSVVGGTIGFVSGVAEPKNLVTGIAAAILTGGAAAFIPSVNRLVKTNTIRGAAKRGAVEGGVAGLLTEPTNIESSKIVQGDYTLTDSLLNVTLGSILGAGLSGGAKAVELRGRGKRLEGIKQNRELIQSYRAETREQAIEEFDSALGQTIQGQAVDVSAVKPIHDFNARNNARKQLPKIEEKITAKQQELGVTPVLPEAFTNSKVIDFDGNISTVYHATDRTFDKFKPNENGIFFTDNPTVASEFGFNVKASHLNMENPHIVDFKGEKGGVDIFDEVHFAKENGFDGVIARNVSEGDAVSPHTQYVAFEPKQVASKYQRDLNIDEAEVLYSLESKKGQAESIANTKVDQAPIQKAISDLQKPIKSSAYDDSPPLSKKEQADLKKSDEDLIEAELEDYQAELQQMQDEGQLTDADMNILEKLADIENEADIFDNVFDNLSLCLTRG